MEDDLGAEVFTGQGQTSLGPPCLESTDWEVVAAVVGV